LAALEHNSTPPVCASPFRGSGRPLFDFFDAFLSTAPRAWGDPRLSLRLPGLAPDIRLLTPRFPYAVLTPAVVHFPSSKNPFGGANTVDRSNIAFALITTILAVYIAVALLLSRARQWHANRSGRRGAPDSKH